MWGYGPEWGMMGGGWGGGWMGPFFMGLIWLIILVVLIAAAVWFVRTTAQSNVQQQQQPRLGRSRGLEVLEERYARGEINREEYLQKKGDLQG